MGNVFILRDRQTVSEFVSKLRAITAFYRPKIDIFKIVALTRGCKALEEFPNPIRFSAQDQFPRTLR